MQVLIGTSGDDPEVRWSPNREDFRLLDEFSRIGIGIGRWLWIRMEERSIGLVEICWSGRGEVRGRKNEFNNVGDYPWRSFDNIRPDEQQLPLFVFFIIFSLRHEFYNDFEREGISIKIRGTIRFHKIEWNIGGWTRFPNVTFINDSFEVLIAFQPWFRAVVENLRIAVLPSLVIAWKMFQFQFHLVEI